MKNIYKLLPLLVLALILGLPTLSNAQNKKCRDKKRKIIPCKPNSANSTNPDTPKTPQYNWTTFTVKDCGFSIEFPGSESEIFHAVPNNEYDLWIVEKKLGNNNVYAVGVTCKPIIYDNRQPYERIFPNAPESLDYLFGFLKSQGLTGNAITHNGHRGVETSFISSADGRPTYLRMFRIHSKQKQLNFTVIASNMSILEDMKSTTNKYIYSLKWVE